MSCDSISIWRNKSETDLPEEVWRDCVENTDYQVSSVGRVRVMVDRQNRNGKHFWAGKIITQSEMPNRRYLRVTLTNKDGGRFPVGTHRLVGRAFVEGETLERNQINHKDGNPQNNNFTNLEWVTCQENKDHAIATGLQWYLYGEDSPQSKLTEKGVELILNRYYYGFEKMEDIGKDFNVLSDYISLIVRGVRWKRVFEKFVNENKEHYDKVKHILSKRNGTNLHKFKSRIEEVL